MPQAGGEVSTIDRVDKVSWLDRAFQTGFGKVLGVPFFIGAILCFPALPIRLNLIGAAIMALSAMGLWIISIETTSATAESHAKSTD